MGPIALLGAVDVNRIRKLFKTKYKPCAMDTDPISEYKKISEVAKEREERQIMRYTEYICAFQIVHDLIPDFFSV